jgi:hypothetical protein
MVDFSKNGSTSLKVASYEKLVDPRAFESEGHLDSLGLCIFHCLLFRKILDIKSNILREKRTTVVMKKIWNLATKYASKRRI